jgi:hypothetical protein
MRELSSADAAIRGWQFTAADVADVDDAEMEDALAQGAADVTGVQVMAAAIRLVIASETQVAERHTLPSTLRRGAVNALN